MKKLISFIFILFATIFIFLSCEKDENEDDKTPPIVSDIRINFEDTIMYEGNAYTFNRSNTSNMDTLVPGHYIKLSARFQDSIDIDKDNLGLSSFMIKIRYDSAVGENAPNKERDKIDLGGGKWRYKDTALYLTKSWQTIFGKQDTTVFDQTQYIQATVTANFETGTEYLSYQQGKYFLIVGCLDKAGNETLVENHGIVLMYREELIKHLKP